MEEKKMFFGVSISAPWPDSFPNAKILKENARHLTLAFLGKTDFSALEKELSSFPKAPFKVGLAGLLDELLFLPEKDPNVVAYHATFFNDSLNLYRQHIISWLLERGLYNEDKRPFLPHVTIGRKPKEIQEWKRGFQPMPFMVHRLCLYESLANSEYKTLWQTPFVLPIEEIEHTADIAFTIRGQTNQELFNNAQIALCYADEKMIPYVKELKVDSFDDVVIELNNINSKVDAEQGSSFKAISFHGTTAKENGLLTWEMFIDV